MPGGQPTKLTPEVQQKICTAISAGNYYQAACAYAGVTYRAFRGWMQRGKKASRGLYFQFFHAVRKAEADAEATIVAQWRQQIPENWPAARDFLARRYPKRWGPKDRHEVTGKDGKPLSEPMTNEQRAAAITAILARLGIKVLVEPDPQSANSPGAALPGPDADHGSIGDDLGPVADEIAPLSF